VSECHCIWPHHIKTAAAGFCSVKGNEFSQFGNDCDGEGCNPKLRTIELRTIEPKTSNDCFIKPAVVKGNAIRKTSIKVNDKFQSCLFK